MTQTDSAVDATLDVAASTIAVQCEACGVEGMVPFYELPTIPVHSVLLMRTRETAVSYPRGDVRLAYCTACGFVSNVLFNESFNDYGQQYEETQGFSPTFSTFHRRLVKQLIERYDIYGKDVIEIGCGKGEFLWLICTEGDNRGVGFDPSYVEERGTSNPAMRVLQDLFSDKYVDSYAADVVCCKMTMEHIASPRKLVRAVRQVLAKRPNGLAFFQVPDFGHILDLAAFWDVYYEHCSYFTAGSLRALFESEGFEVLTVDREYNGQYLTIVARPAVAAQGAIATRGTDESAAHIQSFAARVQSNVESWEMRIRRYTDKGRRVVLWGGGSKAVAFLSTVPVNDVLQYAVDINPYRQGTYLAGSGQRIVAPDFLREYQPDFVVVMNPVYVDEITRDLRRLGLSPEVAALGA
jgi:SAM-dependent methyltransferase